MTPPKSSAMPKRSRAWFCAPSSSRRPSARLLAGERRRDEQDARQREGARKHCVDPEWIGEKQHGQRGDHEIQRATHEWPSPADRQNRHEDDAWQQVHDQAQRELQRRRVQAEYVQRKHRNEADAENGDRACGDGEYPVHARALHDCTAAPFDPHQVERDLLMHLLAAQAGAIQQEGEAIDLAQRPGALVFASSADSELSMLAAAADRAGEDELRLANTLRLSNNLSVDLWLEQTVAHARLVVLRLIGGAAYFQYGVDELTALCANRRIPLALLPGDANPDPILQSRSTIHPNDWNRLHSLFIA